MTDVNRQVSSYLTKHEAGLSQAKIGDCRQLLKILKQQHYLARKCGEVSLLQELFVDAEIAAHKRMMKRKKK